MLVNTTPSGQYHLLSTYIVNHHIASKSDVTLCIAITLLCYSQFKATHPVNGYIGYVYTGTMERFYLEPFRVGTDRLPVYMMSWNRSLQKVNNVVENIVVEHCPF